jgi:hypothetical protein
MTDRIRIRRPWLGVLAPATAAVFSAALVWASGHDPAPAVVAAAADSSTPTTSPTIDAAAGLNRQLAAQERQLARLSADVRTLRSAVADRTSPPTPSATTTPTTTATTSSTTRSGASHVAPPPPSAAPATRTPTRPTPSAVVPRPAHAPSPPPIPTPHVTTRSS